MIEYKGYAAAIEFDDSVGRLHGRIVNSGPYPIATFEATDVEGLRTEFRRSVDEYLASCEEDGVEPRKPFSGKPIDEEVANGTAIVMCMPALA